MDKKIIRFDDTEIEEYDVHQYEKISDIDINEIVVYNKFHFGKKYFKILLVTKIIKKLDIYSCSLQKQVYIKDDLIYLQKQVYIKDNLIRLHVFIL